MVLESYWEQELVSRLQLDDDVKGRSNDYTALAMVSYPLAGCNIQTWG